MRKDIIKTLFGFSFAILLLTLTGCDKNKAANDNPPVMDTISQAGDMAQTKPVDSTAADQTDSIDPSEPTEMTEEADKEDAAPDSSAKKTTLCPVYMGVWGTVGGDGFLFDMDGTTGSYIPYDLAEAKEHGARRQLKLVSYDPKSGKCIIDAFLSGKYIGQFDGDFFEGEEIDDEDHTHTFQTYYGTFKSVKGAKLTFRFHFD